MKTVKIYDPAMCCSTGVCGPEVEPELLALANYLKKLDSGNVKVERYNLAQEPLAFTVNSTVSKLLVEKGVDVLPIVFVDDNVVSTGGYPSEDEFNAALGVNR